MEKLDFSISSRPPERRVRLEVLRGLEPLVARRVPLQGVEIAAQQPVPIGVHLLVAARHPEPLAGRRARGVRHRLERRTDVKVLSSCPISDDPLELKRYTR